MTYILESDTRVHSKVASRRIRTFITSECCEPMSTTYRSSLSHESNNSFVLFLNTWSTPSYTYSSLHIHLVRRGFSFFNSSTKIKDGKSWQWVTIQFWSDDVSIYSFIIPSNYYVTFFWLYNKKSQPNSSLSLYIWPFFISALQFINTNFVSIGIHYISTN